VIAEIEPEGEAEDCNRDQSEDEAKDIPTEISWFLWHFIKCHY